jgi:protease I
MSKSLLMVLAPEQFRDEELLIPKQQFEQAGYSVTLASTQAGVAKGMLGAEQPVEQTLTTVQPEDYQAVIVVGGYGSVLHLWNNTQLHQLLKAFDAQAKVLAAICLSSVVLAKAGLLSGQQASVWKMPESLEAFSQEGVTFSEAPVTAQGRFVTANGPEAAEAFAESVLAALSVTVAS